MLHVHLAACELCAHLPPITDFWTVVFSCALDVLPVIAPVPMQLGLEIVDEGGGVHWLCSTCALAHHS